ncbi:MAG: hypothetical protein EBV06_13830 [Planctomycetia bacterium]|nr:hypothetical protein [Planctomycetia bacterium]
MDLLLRVRPDVRFVANHFLAGFMELRSLLLQVDPFGGGRAVIAVCMGCDVAAHCCQRFQCFGPSGRS